MSYLEDKFDEMLGCTPKGGGSPDKSWTPNNIRKVFVGKDSMYVEYHVGEGEWVELNTDMLETGGEFEDMFIELDNRVYSGLEEIYLTPEYAKRGNINKVVARYSKRRLHTVGIVVNESMVPEGSSVKGQELDNPDWVKYVNLQPEAYSSDAADGALAKVMQGYLEEAGEGEGDEPTELEKAVYAYLAPYVKGSTKSILEAYGKIFSSGYEVIKPYGILSEDPEGLGVALRLEGNALVTEEHHPVIQEAYEGIKKKMNLKVVQTRKIEEIANLIATGYRGKDRSGDRLDGNLYFPLKMLEYAYGRERATADSDQDNNYPPASTSNSWEKYSNTDIKLSLELVVQRILYRTLENQEMLETRAKPEARALIQKSLDKIKQTFCTVIMVSKFEVMDYQPSILKVRVLDPFNALPRSVNLATEAVFKGMGEFDGGDEALSFPVESSGYYVEYTHEADHTLANAEPLYAYKALQALQKQGMSPSWESLIMGIATDDTILRAGSGIDMTANLCHHVLAGSRAGKGVWTLNGLAAAVISGKPILYTDNKPDMASLLLHLSPGAYSMNGKGLTHKPGEGTDYFSKFNNADSWVNTQHIPDYVQDMVGGTGYSNIGEIVYLRSILLSMSVLAARVKNANHYEALGGENGILIVADELSNASSELNTFLSSKVSSRLVHTKFARDMKEYREALEEYEENGGRKPKAPDEVAQPADMWFTALYEKLRESVTFLQEIGNAGLKNSESKVSDVFVLSQSVFRPIEGIGEVDDLFLTRNKTSMGRAGTPANKDLLPSLVMLGGVDGFLGYHKDQGGHLAQSNPNSHAAGKLDPIARNFGYVKNFQGRGRDAAVSGSLEASKNAVYFKPFLLFSDGDEDAYFVKNSFDYASSAGLDPKKVVARNEDPNNPGHIHPAVGFEQYLNLMGLSSEQISTNLAKGGEIAQYLVSEIGYPGTWKEFLMDMRPEWIFSINDVVKALSGDTMDKNVPVRLKEFYGIYPEVFPGGSAGSGSNGEDSNSFEAEDFDGSGAFGNGFDSEDLYSEEDDEEVTGENPYTAVSTPYDPYGFNPPVEAVDGADGASGGLDASLDAEELEAALDAGVAAAEAEGYAVPPKPEWDPAGVGSTPEASYGFQGEAEDFKEFELPEEQPIDMGESQFSGSYEDMAELARKITEDVVKFAGGSTRVRRLAVVGTALGVNGKVYRCRLSPGYMASLPSDIARELQTGNVATYFNWGTLPRLRGLTGMSFESAEFVYDNVSTQMGWGARVSINLFFEEINSLSEVVIRGVKYTRSTYKEQLKDDQTFYQPAAIRRATDLTEAALMRGAGKSWSYTRGVVSRKDIGFWSKAWRVTGGVTGAAATGTAGVGVMAGRGLLGKARKGIRSIGRMLADEGIK